MKPNRFKQVLCQGGVPVGHMLDEFGTRGMGQILETAGVDFVLLDTEHSGFTIAQIADLLAWFAGTSVAPIVRVPQIEYHLIARCLDSGALGVMVPDVRSGAQAKAIISGRDYVIPDDVKFLVIPVLAHRLIMKYDLDEELIPEEYLKMLLEDISFP